MSKTKKKFSLFSSSKKDSTPTVRKDMISAPLDFVHEVHVGFDSETQEFSGLPDTWRSLLKISGLTKEEISKNPQGMLDVLGFYTDGQGGPPAPGNAPSDAGKYMVSSPGPSGGGPDSAPATPAAGNSPPPAVPVRPGFTISEATKPIVRQPPQPAPERKPAAPKKSAAGKARTPRSQI